MRTLVLCLVALSISSLAFAAEKKLTAKQKADIELLVQRPECADYVSRHVPCPSLIKIQQAAAEKALLAVLKDPDSYRPVNWIRCTEDAACLSRRASTAALHARMGITNAYTDPVMKEGTLWTLYYRARNGFGGYTFESQAFWFHNTTNLIKMGGAEE